MNIIDLIVGLVLVVAVFSGLRQGFIAQVGALAGLAIGIWMASKCGAAVGGWFRLEATAATVVGFIVVLVVVILAVGVITRVMRRIWQFGGLACIDRVVGVVVSVVKYLFLMGALFAALEVINVDHSLAKQSTIEKSTFYRPLMRMTESIFPVGRWVREGMEALAKRQQAEEEKQSQKAENAEEQ